MRAPRLLLRLMSKAFALVALFVVFTAGVASAQTCYVDTGGDDAFNGLAAAFDGTNGPNRTINACLGEPYVDDGDIISIEAGDYNEAIIVTEDLIFEARPTGSFTVVDIDDGVTIDNDVTFRANTLGGDAGTFLIGSGNLAAALVLDDGSLTIDSPGRLVVAAGGTVTRDDDTAVTGTVSYAGAANLVYTDNNASNTNVTAGGEFPANFANGDLTVNLGGNNTLTFTTTTGITDLSVGAATELVGTIVVNTNINITGPGNVGSLDINTGNVTILSDVAAGTVDIASTSGTFDLNGFTLSVTGDFFRLGGTFTPDGGTLAFIGDDTNNTLSPGPNFSVGSIMVDKDGQTLSITEDIDVTLNGVLVFSVAANSTVNLGGEQINVTGTGIVDIDGTIVDLATGGVVFTGAGTLRGDGTYGNLFIATGGPDVTVDGPAGAEEDVLFAGILTLTSGGITVADATDDLSPVDGAEVLVNVSGNGNITGSFNAANNTYDLRYAGEIPGVLYTGGTEFGPAGAGEDGVNNVVFTTTGGTVDLSAQGGGTVSGNFTLTGDPDVADAFTVLVGDNLVIEGSLTVGQNATLDGSVVGDTDITLAGASNSVTGTVTTDIDLLLNNGVTLTGTTATALPAVVGDVTIATNGSATITNIQSIVGDLVTNAGSSLTLTLADEQDITGDLTANGSSLILGSLVDVGGNVSLDNVALNFQGNNLLVAGNFSGTNDVTYASAGGRLVLDTANKTFGTAGVSIPNVTITGVTATQTSAATIGSSLIETGAGMLDQAGFALTLNGAATTDGGIFIDNTGAAAAMTFNTTTLTMSADAQIDAPFTIADGMTLTLASNSATERVLTVDGGALTLNGTLALGSQDLNLINGNDLLNVTGSVTANQTGLLILSGGTNNVEVNGNQLDVPNLSVQGVSLLGAASNGTLRITNTLILNNTFSENDASDALVIADLVTITMNAGGSLAAADPTFEGLVSLIYNTVTAATGNEVPDAGGLQNLTINAVTNFDQDATVNGTLTLAAGLTTSTAGDIITLADGATLRLETDNAAVPATKLSATNYTLEYAGPSDTISNNEFLAGATVTTLAVNPGGGDIITLDQARTVNNVLLDSGELEMGGAALSVMGDLTFAGGTLDNDGGQAPLSFTGGNAATITLEGDYVVDDITVTLDKSGNAIVTLTGPPGATLDFFTTSNGGDVETLVLNGGILETDSNTDVFLWQSSTTQGFTRTLGAGEASHIAGNVTKRLLQGDPFTPGRSARFEFPTGSSDGEYRPAVLTFRENIVSQTDITVNHEAVSPEGVLGLPLTDDSGVTIGNYPDFFWLFDATTSLGQAQMFDVELTGTEIGIPFTDDDDLRIIRRFDGDANTNEWEIQGSAANYDNFMAVDADGDTTAVIRVTNSSGGIVPQGARFTLGIPTRPPAFTATPAGGALTVDEGEVVTFDFDADPQDLGETVTFSLEGAPDFVSIDPQTGVLTAEPGSDDAGVYTFFVVATDQTGSTSFEVTLTVNDVFTISPAQADTSIAVGATLTIDFDAVGLTAGEEVVWCGIPPNPCNEEETVDNADLDAATGVFTFTPDIDQADSTFTFTVSATNGVDTVTVSFDVTVTLDLLLGDANLSGEVTALDASIVLQHAAAITTLQDVAFLNADVSGNGQVTAFDAALILQFVAGIIESFPAEEGGKVGLVATGDPAWGDVSFDEVQRLLNVPITLTGDVNNVYSVEFTADVDVELLNFRQVTGALPKDWQVSYSFDKERGQLKLAAAGATPLKDAGVIANATFEQLDANSKPVFRAEGFVNENATMALAELIAEQLPTKFDLNDNYPNPFNPSTTISFDLPEKAKVVLEVYDVAGRLVQTLVNQEREAGRYTIQWDGRNAAGSQVASGLYVYRITAGSFVKAKTMLLVK